MTVWAEVQDEKATRHTTVSVDSDEKIILLVSYSIRRIQSLSCWRDEDEGLTVGCWMKPNVRESNSTEIASGGGRRDPVHFHRGGTGGVSSDVFVRLLRGGGEEFEGRSGGWERSKTSNHLAGWPGS